MVSRSHTSIVMVAERRCETAGILDVAGSQATKKVDGVMKTTPENSVPNRTVDSTVREISERIIQVMRTTWCERLQQRME